MTDFDVNDVASVGLIRDIPGYQLPPEAWTTAQDVRLIDDGVYTGATWTTVLDTSVAPGPASPYYIIPIRMSPSQVWAVYTSLLDVFVWDGASGNTKITGPVNSTGNGYDWNGTTLSGSPILTNNINPPQYWPGSPSMMTVLPNWTAVMGTNGYCRSIRAFGPYLVAMNLSISGVAHPHGVAWSHPADPGTMPSSWDYNDPTKDAGLTELTDAGAGVVVDGLPLRSVFVIYKDQSTWLMQLVGGQYIMQFSPFLLQTGILAPHCVALTGDGKYHFVVTNDDIIIHDGISAQSILDRRMRRAIFNNISSSNYMYSHVFAVPTKREMWFAYPEAGQAKVTRALVWSYGAGTAPQGVLYEAVIPFACGTLMDLVDPSDTWANDLDPWNMSFEPWVQAARQRTVLCDPTSQKLVQLDSGSGRYGAGFTGTVQRVPISLIGTRRTSGDPVTEWAVRKFVRRVWPKAEGGLLTVRLGFCNVPGGPVSWTSTKTFDPTSQHYLDFVVNDYGAPTVEFSWIGTVGALFGYKMEVVAAGRF